jgi:hypothetical protein
MQLLSLYSTVTQSTQRVLLDLQVLGSNAYRVRRTVIELTDQLLFYSDTELVFIGAKDLFGDRITGSTGFL